MARLIIRNIFRGIVSVILHIANAQAQEVKILGTVAHSENGEIIQMAKIYETSKNQSVSSNRLGFFSLSIPKGNTVLVIHASGFKTETVSLHNILSDTTLDIRMKEWSEILDTVTIQGSAKMLNQSDGLYRMTGKLASKMPLALSEPDLLKAIQLLPGVQGGDDGSSGIHIRGGSPDQTLILIDGVPVYNITHLFGFFSVLNPDVIATADLYKNELPARYGGRLSSVLDVTMREGNRNKMQGGIHISPISAKLRLEGPIKKDTSSYIISFRRSWLDLLTSLAQRVSDNNLTSFLGFSDATAKANHKFSKKDQLFFSSYWGKDSFGTLSKLTGYNSRQSTSWGNLTGVVRYHRIFGSKLFSQNMLSHTRYKSQFRSSSDVDGVKAHSLIKSVIADISLKSDWSFQVAPDQKMEWGAGISRHSFRPDVQIREGNAYEADWAIQEPTTIVMDYQVYGLSERRFGRLDLRLGFHFNRFDVNQKTYNMLQARVGSNLAIAEKFGIKAAFFQSGQYLHLLTNSSIGVPTNLWVPVTEKLAPQSSTQVSSGFWGEAAGVKWSLEGYYKTMENLLEYTNAGKGGVNLHSQWQDRVTTGNGTSRGIEFFAERKSGKLEAFVSYTWSKTDRMFPLLNEGKKFPYKYDRRHTVNIFSEYRVNERSSFQVVFHAASGNFITLPAAQYSAQPGILSAILPETRVNGFINSFDELEYLPYRNNFQMRANHHLDISYKISKKKIKGFRTWTFSVYNLYNRRNPYFLFIQDSQLKQFSLLPVLPSVSYAYSF